MLGSISLDACKKMKCYFATSILTLLCTCLIGHAGTVAAVTATLRVGDKKPVVAEKMVDLTNRVYLQLTLPDRRVWTCHVDARYTRDLLRDSISVIVTDSTRLGSTQAPLVLFSGKLKGDFGTGEETVVFRSGTTSLELEIQPEIEAGDKDGARQPAAAAGSKSEGKEKPQPESEERSK
ncbi:MAG: hypothetical protein ACR2RV_16725 [Verrucomicrobiales bacterium]